MGRVGMIREFILFHMILEPANSVCRHLKLFTEF